MTKYGKTRISGEKKYPILYSSVFASMIHFSDINHFFLLNIGLLLYLLYYSLKCLLICVIAKYAINHKITRDSYLFQETLALLSCISHQKSVVYLHLALWATHPTSTAGHARLRIYQNKRSHQSNSHQYIT